MTFCGILQSQKLNWDANGISGLKDTRSIGLFGETHSTTTICYKSPILSFISTRRCAHTPLRALVLFGGYGIYLWPKSVWNENNDVVGLYMGWRAPCSMLLLNDGCHHIMDFCTHTPYNRHYLRPSKPLINIFLCRARFIEEQQQSKFLSVGLIILIAKEKQKTKKDATAHLKML